MQIDEKEDLYRKELFNVLEGVSVPLCEDKLIKDAVKNSGIPYANEMLEYFKNENQYNRIVHFTIGLRAFDRFSEYELLTALAQIENEDYISYGDFVVHSRMGMYFINNLVDGKITVCPKEMDAIELIYKKTGKEVAERQSKLHKGN